MDDLNKPENGVDSPAASGLGPLANNSRKGSAWRQSRWLAFVEFAIVGLVFVADHYHFIPLSKTPFLLLIGWISLRIRQIPWSAVGFTLNRSWARTLIFGIAGGLILELFQLFVTQPLLTRLTGKQPDLSDFQSFHGNIKYCLLGLVFAWTFAAFGEELVWRGYLMNRAAGLLCGTRAAWICSLVLVNAVFGCAHSYQGLTGILEEALAGLFLGLMYLRSGKNLAVPILAHGVSDTLDVVLMFFGKMPGA